MSIPSSLRKSLDDDNIAYELVSAGEPIDSAHGTSVYLREHSAALSIVLYDGAKKLHVVFPADCMLDLQALNRELGANYRAVSAGDLQELCKSKGVDALPALPNSMSLPCLMDKRLLDQERLIVDMGQADEFIALPKTSVATLQNSCQSGNFCVHIDELENRLFDIEQDSDLQQITQAVSQFTSLRIKQRLEDTLEFPPLPETAQKIIKLRVNPNADIKDLSNIVETDPALASQVVSWASSPYYGAPGKIRSVHDAIVRVLGFDLVLNLSLGLALSKTLSLPKEGARGFTPYWQQAAYTAAGVETLVGKIPMDKRPGVGLAYLTGLLHNFGYLILAEIFPPQFADICRLAEANPHVNHCVLEYHVLGISREQLSSWLMQLWNMPEEVCLGLRYQSNPEYHDLYSDYSRLIYVTKSLLSRHAIGDAPISNPVNASCESLHLDVEDAEEAIAKLLENDEQLQAMAESMGGK